jgi:hypothetical protein
LGLPSATALLFSSSSRRAQRRVEPRRERTVLFNRGSVLAGCVSARAKCNQRLHSRRNHEGTGPPSPRRIGLEQFHTSHRPQPGCRQPQKRSTTLPAPSPERQRGVPWTFPRRRRFCSARRAARHSAPVEPRRQRTALFNRGSVLAGCISARAKCNQRLHSRRNHEGTGPSSPRRIGLEQFHISHRSQPGCRQPQKRSTTLPAPSPERQRGVPWIFPRRRRFCSARRAAGHSAASSQGDRGPLFSIAVLCRRGAPRAAVSDYRFDEIGLMPWVARPFEHLKR